MNDVFRALSDPTRREIVQLLRSGSRTAGEIAAAFPLAKSTLSAHFNILKQAGLIVGERHGASIVYRLNTSVLHDLAWVLTPRDDRERGGGASGGVRRLVAAGASRGGGWRR
jgi:DNA-binding transcriptional ArsR family regulator